MFMKRAICHFIIMVLVMLLVSSITAREKKDLEAILARLKEHREKRIAEFEKENAGLKNVVFLGDSLTEGFKLDEYFPGLPSVNRGIVADHIGVQGKPGLIQRLDVSVFDCNPSIVVLMIGVNDIGDDDHDIDTMVAGYSRLIEKVQSHDSGIEVIVQSCLPAGRKYARLNPTIEEFNTRIKKIADEYGCAYVDLYPLFTDEKGELKDELTREGLHLKKEGYDIWAAELRKYLPVSEKSPDEDAEETTE
jgi:lysophospholipase L1-like esterase